jgi:hypothetical protein
MPPFPQWSVPMILELTTADRLAKAKQRRRDDRLLFVCLHMDYILCPMLIAGFAILVKVVS